MLTGLNVIGDLTNTLVELLSGLDVTLDSPANLTGSSGSFQRINLYLYQVLEDPFAKQQVWDTLSPDVQRFPPLALDLHYLLTPYASDTLSAHRVLGEAMRIFHETAVLRGPQLPDSLRLSINKVSIILNPLKLEELTRIWNSLQTAYRLSIAYEVKVVMLESHAVRDITRISTSIKEYHYVD
jgi:hypothetical protein